MHGKQSRSHNLCVQLDQNAPFVCCKWCYTKRVKLRVCHDPWPDLTKIVDPVTREPKSWFQLPTLQHSLLHTIYYMFLSPPRPLVVKPAVLQLQQFGIPSHPVSGNHLLLAPSNIISKLIYLPSPTSPFSHPATPAPPTRACLNLCAIQIL